MKFSTTIVGWGEEALEFLPPNEVDDNNFIVIFNENAPEELADLAILHTIVSLDGEPEVGDTVVICGKRYTISAVGSEVVHTLRTLGHCTLNFKGGSEPEMLGCIMLEGEQLTGEDIRVGGEIQIF